MSKLAIPRKINKGDTVGIVCPSAGIHPLAAHRIEKAKDCLERMGYKVKIGKSVFSKDGTYVSGGVEERIADLNDMFNVRDVRMILAGIGGNHSNHLLDSLDYSLIKSNPKIVCGYSDITVLHYALNTQSGLATYYGPCAATQFGEYPDILPYTKQWFETACVENTKSFPMTIVPSDAWTAEFMDWFKKLDQTRPRHLVANKGYKWISEGKSHGEALPGCILSMNRLAGTRYWIDPKGKILFLDVLVSTAELDEALVDSFLTDLGNIGVFEDIVGLVVGRPLGYSDAAKRRLYDRILELTQNKYPIVTEFDLGHTDPMVTIRYGQGVRLDSSMNEITFLD
jgi:muramoyltetrapeptide carboxypeptidase